MYFKMEEEEYTESEERADSPLFILLVSRLVFLFTCSLCLDLAVGRADKLYKFLTPGIGSLLNRARCLIRCV